MRALALSVLLLTSCGGKTETGTSGTPTGSEDCSVPDEWFTSTAAIRIARCPEFAGPDAVVVSLVSSRNGDMDEDGRAALWDVLTWTSEQVRRIQIYYTNGVTIEEASDLSCSALPSTDPAPSDEVVPDAVERVAPFDPYEDKRFTARLYSQQVQPCLANAGPSGVSVIRSTTPDDGVSFYVEYTWTGQFESICGPCSGSLSLQCEDNCR